MDGTRVKPETQQNARPAALTPGRKGSHRAIGEAGRPGSPPAPGIGRGRAKGRKAEAGAEGRKEEEEGGEEWPQ